MTLAPKRKETTPTSSTSTSDQLNPVIPPIDESTTPDPTEEVKKAKALVKDVLSILESNPNMTHREIMAKIKRESLLTEEPAPEIKMEDFSNEEELKGEVPLIEEGETLDKLNVPTVNLIIRDFSEHYKISPKASMVAITRLVQEGGTNASKTKLIRIVNGITFDIEVLRKIIKQHAKTGTVRQFAKCGFIRDLIARIALINNWEGPLFKDLSRQNPSLNISSPDAVYCCEIHTDNYGPLVPALIREALQRREQKIKDESLKKSPPKAPKAGKKRKGGKK